LLIAIWVASFVIFCFSVLYAVSTLSLTGLSLYEALQQKVEHGDRFRPPIRPLRPGITLIAAAYDELPIIVTSVRSLLAADYDPLEVVIVDDGSTDGTTDALVDAFDLVPLPVGERLQIQTEAVERIYVSRSDPRLRVAYKRNGRRADALNVGINLARHDLIATTDVDSLLEPDALARIVEVFSADPDRVVAVGGTVRIANGSVVQQGMVVEPRVPLGGTPASQVAEYIRLFFGARIGWAALNGLLIISGAFGVFRRDVCGRSAGSRGTRWARTWS
jgi:cellulose synthase/poly-beta-1,6-N-acetylglucosamine synthase-like glycosyltransferase